MNIALISPNKNAYSETFIQAQKSRLEGDVFYYYDGFLPRKLEGEGSILIKYGGLKKRLGLIEKDILSDSVLKSFRANKIDVVLAHYGPTGEALAPICKALNILLIVHFHGYDASVISVIEQNKRYKNAFKVAYKIIAVSKEMRQDLHKMGCPEDKIVYSPCAPNPEFFDLEPKFVKQQFIALGRFTDKKAPYYTILAFSKVLQNYPEATLIFGGKGELVNSCKNLVKYLGIGSSVEFKGVISQKEFMDLLLTSLAFVQHSIQAENGDKEGTPVAIMEASLAGLPVIATKHAGIKEVIVDNETGLLCEEHDVDEMAKHMLTLLSDKVRAQKLGSKGKLRIQGEFNMGKHIQTLDNIISFLP